jgi:pimeloyl-ACP methyl ester carboxylesterase
MSRRLWSMHMLGGAACVAALTALGGALLLAASGSVVAAADRPDDASLRYRAHTVPHVIGYDDGASLALERGVFFVPSDHGDRESALLQLAFYRLPATGEASAPPLFLLAGGPGNTYFDDIQRSDFRSWLEHYRQIGDIVILEQRGASEAHPKPVCDYPLAVPLDRPIDLEETGAQLRGNVLRCVEAWRAAGLVLEDFNLVQMARDFDELRRVLGYKQFNLKGGSFGSQLGLTILRRHGDSVHRAVLYGVEGPDHSYDLPALVNAQLDKVAVEVAADPVLGRAMPGLVAVLDDLLARLDEAPVTVTLGARDDGDPVEVTLGRSDLELLLWSQPLLQGYRDGIAKVPALLLAAAAGDFRPFAEAKLEFAHRRRGVNVMTYAVDCASGMSAGRAQALTARDPAWVLSPAIVDYHLHAVCDALAVDLGETFRRDVQVDVPVLFISGTLDGFTPPEYAEATLASFPAGHWLLAERGDHSGWDILEQFPPLKAAVRDFLAGEPLPADFPSRVEMPPLEFVVPSPSDASAGR